MRIVPARGFGLVSALFLMVVLAALAGYLVNMVAVQQSAPAMKLQSTRALYAARAGLAWAARRARATGACPAAATLALTEATLDGFLVSVNCSRSDHALGGLVRPYFVIDVSAQLGIYGSTDFVSRSLQAKVAG